MKNVFAKLLVLALCVCVLLCFASCEIVIPDEGGNEGGGENKPPENEGNGNTDTDSGNADNTDKNDPDAPIDWDNLPLEGLALISNSTARFQVVYTTDAGSTGIREAEALVKKLVALGVNVGPAVSDKNAADVKDCEIIIGTAARHRGDELNVNSRYLGENGMLIKVVGNRILIAGGSPRTQKAAIGIFVEEEMKITDDTEKLSELAVNPAYFKETLTRYYFDAVKIGGRNIKEYVLIQDLGGLSFSFDRIKTFREDLYAQSGAWLEFGRVDSIDTYEHKVVIRYNPEMENEDGFSSYVTEAGDWIIECAFANAFDNSFGEVVDAVIFDVVGKEADVPADHSYSKRVCEVTYEQFGATDNGEEDDDFQAIYDAHVYANQCGQKVLGKEGATYYVKFLPETIPVRTNVDLLGATIKVNDKGSDAYQTRGTSLFTFQRENAGIFLDETKINELSGGNEKLYIGEWSVPWLAGVIIEKSIVKFTNKNHKDVIRHGSNQSSGEYRRDVYIMYPDGSIDSETEVCFDFEEITSIEIYSANDAPITFENGTIINQCCEVVAETQYMNKYHAYARGLDIRRPNVTIYNITHKMEDEPILNTDSATGGSQWGTLHESYPYYAFVLTHMAYNLHVLDTNLAGHTTYYEDKPETESSGGKPKPVAQGTYDIAVEESISVLFENVHQYNSDSNTNLADRRYWGIMTSNWSKDTTFKNCSINRFDAHRTMWGAALYNTTIGHTISVVGGGYFYLEGVTKLSGDRFIELRGDYGATFRGTIEMVDCKLDAVKDYNSTKGQSLNTNSKHTNAVVIRSGFSNNNNTKYWDWNFGYECYLPNVVLDNFTSTATRATYVFNELVDTVFTDSIANRYRLAETITFRNMNKTFDTCKNISLYKEMQKIKVKSEGNTN